MKIHMHASRVVGHGPTSASVGGRVANPHWTCSGGYVTPCKVGGDVYTAQRR